MNIKYKLTIDDLLLNQLYIASKSKRIKRRRVLNRLIFSIAYLTFAVLGLISDNNYKFIIFLTISILWFFLHPIFTKNSYRKHYLNHVKEYQSQNVGKLSTLSIQNNNLLIVEESCEAKLNLKEIVDIIELSRNYLLRINSGGNIIIPKKLLEGDMEQFVNELCNQTSLSIKAEVNWKWT